MPDIKSGRTAIRCPIGNAQQFSLEDSLIQLNPAVGTLACTFTSWYYYYFCQVGRIGIWNESQKYTILLAFEKFKRYAIRAAKFGMIDFYRLHMKRQLPMHDSRQPLPFLILIKALTLILPTRRCST